MIDFELKIPARHGPIRSRLRKLKAKFIEIDFNHDVYYNHPTRDFRNTDEALRIRNSRQGLTLTYKGPKLDNRSKTRKELNVGILNKNIEELLLLLDFKRSGEVKKERETWLFDNVNILLDDVEGLQNFVELEILGDDEEQKSKVENKLKITANKLGLDPETHKKKSYLKLLEIS